MNAADLRSLPIEELEGKMKDLKEEYLRLRCNHVTRQLGDVMMIKKTRREIARLNTVLKEMQNQNVQVEG